MAIDPAAHILLTTLLPLLSVKQIEESPKSQRKTTINMCLGHTSYNGW